MKLSTDGLVLASGAAIDLQMHTVFSDGLWTPETLIDHLISENFGLAAFTDHDRTDQTTAIQTLALEKGLPVLLAAEMSTTWRGGYTDVLAFGFDPADAGLNALVQDVQRRQRENTALVYENLCRAGYDVPGSDIAQIMAKPGATQPRALIALAEKYGHGTPERPADNLVWESGCLYQATEIAVVVEAVQRSGGVCLVAHPGRGAVFTKYDADLLDALRRDVPIDGIEAYYPAHSPEQTAMFKDYAKKHDLLTSSGSDSHGPHKKPIKYPADLSRKLLERVGITVN